MVPCKVVKAVIISYVLLGKALTAYFVGGGGGKVGEDCCVSGGGRGKV